MVSRFWFGGFLEDVAARDANRLFTVPIGSPRASARSGDWQFVDKTEEKHVTRRRVDRADCRNTAMCALFGGLGHRLGVLGNG